MKTGLRRGLLIITIVSLMLIGQQAISQEFVFPELLLLDEGNLHDLERIAMIESLDAEGMNWISSMAINTPGSVLAVGRDNGILSLYDLPSLQLRAEFHDHAFRINSLAFSHVDNDLLVSGSIDGKIIFTNVRTLQSIVAFEFKKEIERISDISLHPLQNILAFSSGVEVGYPEGNQLSIRNMQGMEEIAYIESPDADINTIQYSPDGKMLISGDSSGKITIWDASDLEKIAVIEAHSSWVNDLAFCPGGSVFASVGEQETKLWDQTDFSLIAVNSIHDHKIYAVSCDKTGSLLVTGAQGGFLQVLDVGRLEEVLFFKAHEYAITSIVISPGNDFIVTGSTDGTVGIWGIVREN